MALNAQFLENKSTAGYEQLVTFWRYFYDCQYILLCSPFRFKVNNFEGRLLVVAKSWLPQKVICSIITFLGIASNCMRVMEAIPSNPKNPKSYLTFGYRIARVMCVSARVKLYWMDQPCFLEISNLLLKTENDILRFQESNAFYTAIGSKYILSCFVDSPGRGLA